MKKSDSRRHRDRVFGAELEGESQIPAPVRKKLHGLFSQIEGEFEKLYSDYVQLQEKHDYLLQQFQTGDRLTENVDGVDGTSKTGGTSKKSSHISQKIKSTYKSSTIRLANTFKNTGSSISGSYIREYTGHKDGVWELNVAKHNNKLLGTASADYTARIWDVDTGCLLIQYYGHHGSVNSIRFHPNADFVLTSSGDQTAHVWKLSSGLQTQTSYDGAGKSSSCTDDIEESDEVISLAPIQTSTHFIHSPRAEYIAHTNVVVAADWITGGGQIVTASWDGSAILFDAETQQHIDSFTSHEGDLTNVISHTSQRLVLTSSKDHSVRLWDLRDTCPRVNALIGHSASVSTAVFGEGDKIITGSDDRTVKMWDMKNMSTPYFTIRTDSPVNRLSVSRQSQIIAVPQDNRNTKLFDINGNRLGRLPRDNNMSHERMVTCASWKDDGGQINLFTSGFGGKVIGWQVAAKTATNSISEAKQ